MKTRNVFSVLLLCVFAFQVHATDFPSLANESVLSTELGQVLRQDSVQLTQKAEIQRPLETMENKLVVRDSHVVMVAENGVTVLERTTQGLVRRHVLKFENPSDVLNFDTSPGDKSDHFAASPDGKKIIWFKPYQQVEIDIAADFTASVKKIATSNFCEFSGSDNPSEFVCSDLKRNKTTVMRMTSAGLQEIARLSYGTSDLMLWNSKDQILIQTRVVRDFGYSEFGQTVWVWKWENGRFIGTDNQNYVSNSSLYIKGFVYDTDKSRLISYPNGGIEVSVDRQTGKLGFVRDLTRSIVDIGPGAYRGSAVISGDAALVRDHFGDDFLLQRDEEGFRRAEDFSESKHTYALHRRTSGQLELWQNSWWSLQHFDMNGSQPVLKQSRYMVERGFFAHAESRILPSDDSRFWLVIELSGEAVVVGMGVNKTPEAKLQVPNIPFWPRHFVRVSTGIYLLAEQDQYRLLTEDSQGQLSISAAKAWPQPIDDNYDIRHVKSKDGQIFLSNTGVHVFKVSDNNLSFVASLQADNQLTDKERVAIDAVVELKGQLFALMPRVGKITQLSWQDNKLTAVKTGTMPVFGGIGRGIIEGRDRIFVLLEKQHVLMPDEKGNLVLKQIDASGFHGQFYRQRMQFRESLIPDEFVRINDPLSGLWQRQDTLWLPRQPELDCCSEAFLLAGHVVTLNSIIYDKSPQVTSYEINTAPYMPTPVAPLQLNQGVEADIVLKTYVQDDEQSDISFSGLSQGAFSLKDGMQLKYNGLTTGKGVLQITASDGELKTDLLLPYQINAAPVLVKPLPVIAANQNVPLQLNLAVHFEDPEGNTISFDAQSLQGFSISQAGLLSGTATGVSNVDLPFVVKDHAGAQRKSTITIKVNAAPALTGSSSASGKVQQSFSLDLNTIITDAEKHNFTLSVQGLPAGLSLNGAVISGTPTAAGSATVTVTAIDELGARNQLTLSLNIVGEDKKGGGSVGFGLVALLALLGLRRR